jgi:hypothetical protein
VYDLRREILAGSALTDEQHWSISRRDESQLLSQGAHW